VLHFYCPFTDTVLINFMCTISELFLKLYLNTNIYMVCAMLLVVAIYKTLTLRTEWSVCMHLVNTLFECCKICSALLSIFNIIIYLLNGEMVLE